MHAILTEHINLYDAAATQWFKLLESIGFSQPQQMAYTAQEITRQGYILASNEVFWLSGWLFVGLTVLVWWARPPFKPGGSESSGAH